MPLIQISQPEQPPGVEVRASATLAELATWEPKRVERLKQAVRDLFEVVRDVEGKTGVLAWLDEKIASARPEVAAKAIEGRFDRDEKGELLFLDPATGARVPLTEEGKVIERFLVPPAPPPDPAPDPAAEAAAAELPAAKT